MKTFIKYFFIGLIIGGVLAFLTGCEDRYRYPCQDPENWDKQECKKPYCTASQTCPDDIFKEDIKPKQSTPEKPTATKGVCK